MKYGSKALSTCAVCVMVAVLGCVEPIAGLAGVLMGMIMIDSIWSSGDEDDEERYEND